MSNDVAASGNDLELWHVQLGGSARTMTLDELDQAFQSGVVNERTMVLKAGALHWTTLGDIAGIETADAQPNSIAPMATDIASSNAVIPALPPPTLDVSFGTEELRVFRPKRRGRVAAAIAAVALVGGAVVGVKSYGLDKLGDQVAAVTALVKSGTGEARAAAGVQPPAFEATADTTATPPLPGTPVSLPSAKGATPAVSVDSLPSAEETTRAVPVDALPSAKGATPAVSVDSLPSATPEKASKKQRSRSDTPRKKAGFAKTKAKSKSSSDPTRRGAGQFDPLNGNL